MNLLCLLRGHKPGWVKARVPNPHAVRSSEWGCERCRKPLAMTPREHADQYGYRWVKVTNAVADSLRVWSPPVQVMVEPTEDPLVLNMVVRGLPEEAAA